MSQSASFPGFVALLKHNGFSKLCASFDPFLLRLCDAQLPEVEFELLVRDFLCCFPHLLPSERSCFAGLVLLSIRSVREALAEETHLLARFRFRCVAVENALLFLSKTGLSAFAHAWVECCVSEESRAELVRYLPGLVNSAELQQPPSESKPICAVEPDHEQWIVSATQMCAVLFEDENAWKLGQCRLPSSGASLLFAPAVDTSRPAELALAEARSWVSGASNSGLVLIFYDILAPTEQARVRSVCLQSPRVVGSAFTKGVGEPVDLTASRNRLAGALEDVSDFVRAALCCPRDVLTALVSESIEHSGVANVVASLLQRFQDVCVLRARSSEPPLLLSVYLSMPDPMRAADSLIACALPLLAPEDIVRHWVAPLLGHSVVAAVMAGLTVLDVLPAVPSAELAGLVIQLCRVQQRRFLLPRAVVERSMKLLQKMSAAVVDAHCESAELIQALSALGTSFVHVVISYLCSRPLRVVFDSRGGVDCAGHEQGVRSLVLCGALTDCNQDAASRASAVDCRGRCSVRTRDYGSVRVD